MCCAGRPASPVPPALVTWIVPAGAVRLAPVGALGTAAVIDTIVLTNEAGSRVTAEGKIAQRAVPSGDHARPRPPNRHDTNRRWCNRVRSVVMRGCGCAIG